MDKLGKICEKLGKEVVAFRLAFKRIQDILLDKELKCDRYDLEQLLNLMKFDIKNFLKRLDTMRIGAITEPTSDEIDHIITGIEELEQQDLERNDLKIQKLENKLKLSAKTVSSAKELEIFINALQANFNDLKKCTDADEYKAHMCIIKDNMKNFIKRISNLDSDTEGVYG
jgi:hypothetical protein